MPDNPLFPTTIETDRLRLEALTLETMEQADVLALYDRCSNDPDIERVTKYLSWDPHTTPRDTLEFLEDVTDRWTECGGGSYAIYPTDGEDGAGEFAGDAGFGVDWDARTMTLGIWLRKRFWGRGYSGERAAAMMALAFDRLDLEVVVIEAHVDNENSNRAIQRYVGRHGGRREGLLRNWRADGGNPVDCYRYTVSRDEYQANPPAFEIRFDGDPAPSTVEGE